MPVRIFHNPRCSKSRQALQLLQDNGQQVETIEYMKSPPDRKELERVISLLGIRPRQLLRKNEKEYRLAGLDDMQKSNDEIIEAMMQYPRLIERPIVISKGKARVGRPPETILEII